jgi:hypothetical protein
MIAMFDGGYADENYDLRGSVMLMKTKDVTMMMMIVSMTSKYMTMLLIQR